MKYIFKNALFSCLFFMIMTCVFAANQQDKIKQKILLSFDKLDADKNASLSFQELSVLNKKIPKAKQKQFGMFLKSLDKNSDQEISRMELKTQSTNQAMSYKTKKQSGESETSLARKTHLNVKYGDHERNVLDVWLVKSQEPAPLVIYIHGGGFKGGDKKKGIRYRDNYLKVGVSFAAINYRFLPQSDDGVFGCFNDSKRALQFISSKAQEWNLDRSKFALLGGSAGAGTSLWLGYKDDMADPDHSDPIMRESTRVSAVAVTATQCTYNFSKWSTLFDTKPQPGTEIILADFYGVKVDELKTKKGQRRIEDADLLIHISKDDPPLYAKNAMRGGKVDINDQNHVNHHPLHVKALKDRALEVGLKHQCHAQALGIDDKPGDDSADSFLIRELKN
ncbi:alpha/beta hydrolase fold domain-containing protein [Lentisphaera marina]|uniref:alpha/beta hydrolase fold domain-containing protein n=1 Tax=Lentisphaera marina TaxID=1111041 RepID=UPI002365F4A3|nr:alpha/beta hydrolase fold domain-containing protein [Lentisphaera marina]MDD7984900.1 alpha/beta hydrolase fold domain-containing protein [Lentisphaera marina]